MQWGEPYFKAKPLCDKHEVAIFSSNYQLYGDMSERVMSVLAQSFPVVEIYSIDEAFLDLSGFALHAVEDYANTIRQRIYQWTGIPVSIGIGPTKTLAKAANHIAKKCTHSGVFSLMDRYVQQSMLQHFDIGDIWGVGRQYSKSLRALNINTAWQLRNCDPVLIRKHFNVIMHRLICELRGISCIGMEQIQPNKTIISSRSFGKTITDVGSLEMAVSGYVSRACEKLRKQGSSARNITVFLYKNRFNPANKSNYYSSLSGQLPIASHITSEHISLAKQMVRRLYKEGIEYKKAGVILSDIMPQQVVQPDLFTHYDEVKKERATMLMQVMDQLNQRMGTRTVYHAALGMVKTWKKRSISRSSRYTTQWHELLCVN